MAQSVSTDATNWTFVFRTYPSQGNSAALHTCTSLLYCYKASGASAASSFSCGALDNYSGEKTKTNYFLNDSLTFQHKEEMISGGQWVSRLRRRGPLLSGGRGVARGGETRHFTVLLQAFKVFEWDFYTVVVIAGAADKWSFNRFV